jgi:hypothetical protein
MEAVGAILIILAVEAAVGQSNTSTLPLSPAHNHIQLVLPVAAPPRLLVPQA